MKISIITVCYNAKDTIKDSIESVLSQDYSDIEYIIVDGASTDGTKDILDTYSSKTHTVIREPDSGLYEALNKGIAISSGEFVGILHADDIFADEHVISNIAQAVKECAVDCVWGDLAYVSVHNPDRIIRYWRSSEYTETDFRRGWMMPHPTLFIKNALFKKYGTYNTRFQIAADYELIVRFMHVHQCKGIYLPLLITKMRIGGLSNRNMCTIIRKSLEDLKAWKVNGLRRGLFAVMCKNFRKLPQFFLRK